MTREPDARVAVFVAKKYTPAPGSEGRVGSGGTERWTFRAVAPGETSFTLGYFPPGGGEAWSPHTVSVVVR